MILIINDDGYCINARKYFYNQKFISMDGSYDININEITSIYIVFQNIKQLKDVVFEKLDNINIRCNINDDILFFIANHYFIRWLDILDNKIDINIINTINTINLEHLSIHNCNIKELLTYKIKYIPTIRLYNCNFPKKKKYIFNGLDFTITGYILPDIVNRLINDFAYKESTIIIKN